MTAEGTDEPTAGSASLAKRALSRLLLIGFGVFVAVVIAEVFLRLVGFSGELRLYEPDRHVGTTLEPGADGTWTREGHGDFDVNSAGFRDREHSLEKPPGTVRIAVLGDSYVEALQVDLDEAFPAVIEREVRRCVPDNQVEVLSFGVSGWGTAQQLLAFRHHVARYSPDIVALTFLTGNDVRNNSRALSADFGEEHVRPYFVLEGEGLKLDNSFRRHVPDPGGWTRSVKRFVYRHSRLAQVVDRIRLGRAGTAADPRGVAAEEGLDNEVYKAPQNARWSEAWQVTEKIIVRMADEVEAHQAEFVLVTLSNGVQVHPDESTREALKEELNVDTVFYPDRRLTEFAGRHGMNALALAPEMREYALRRDAYLHGFENTELGTGHWNELGHRVAGRMIAEHLCATALGRDS